MKKRPFYPIAFVLALLTAFGSCGVHKDDMKDAPESKEAKRLLQGMWIDHETEDVVFTMKGDSVFYPDSTSMPAYFKVVDDTIYIGQNARYHIEKHTEHLLWFKSQDGMLMKLEKSDGTDIAEVIQPAQIQQVNDGVTKSDTVVFWEGNRYHLFIAVNPTKQKVVRHTLNADGLDVTNVYYDNIIHLSVFQGTRKLFSRDFRKHQYQQRMPAQYFSQLVISGMSYDRVDADGFHLMLSLCVPGDASCYQLEHVVSHDGKLIIKNPQ